MYFLLGISLILAFVLIVNVAVAALASAAWRVVSDRITHFSPAAQARVIIGLRVMPVVLAVVFVFLVLAAQFESLTLPVAVILIVPMCLIASIVGVVLRGQDNNILTQVGFIVLIGLAAKNAILIVEFAKQLEDAGRDRIAAAVEAARLRLRPILMTSLAFVFGVAPLVVATGAGSEMRQSLGTAVFSGMLGVTAFGLLFTPAFYTVARKLGSGKLHKDKVAPKADVHEEAAKVRLPLAS